MGSSPVSDTNNLRYLESHFRIENIQRRGAGNFHLQMIWDNRYPLDELFDQNLTFLVVATQPNSLNVEIPEEMLATCSKRISRSF